MALLPISADGSGSASSGAARGCCAGVNIGIAMGQSGECVTDAPSDGKIHGRKDAAWVEIPDGAVVDSLSGGAANEAPSVRAVNEALGGKASQADISQAVAQIRIPTVANTLTSTSTTDALSAAMGRELKAQADRKLELPTANIEIIVDGVNGDDATATGSEAKPYRTITAALNAIPAITTLDVALRIKAGIYEVPQVSLRLKKGIGGRLDFKSFSGAKDVEWRSSGPNSALEFISMMCRVKFDGIKFSPSIGSTVPICLHFVQSQLGSVNNCEFSGFPTSILAAYDGCCFVHGCSFANTTTAIKAEYGSTVTSSSNSSGSAVQLGLSSNASVIYKVGTQPTGETGNEYKAGGGQIFG